MKMKEKRIIPKLIALIISLIAFLAVLIFAISIKGNGIGKIKLSEMFYEKKPLQTYQVNFVLNGGDWKEGNSYGSGTMHYEIGTRIDAPTQDKDYVYPGFTIEGWYTDLQFEHRWDFSQDVVTQDITLYANYTRNKYKVKFYNQFENEGSVPELLYEQEVYYGYTLVQDGDELGDYEFKYEGPKPQRENHSFVDWISTTGSYTITQDTNFVARYTSDFIYVITVNYLYENGSVAGNTYVSTKSENDTYDIESPTFEGYTTSVERISGTVTRAEVEKLEKLDYVQVDWNEEAKTCNIFFNVVYKPGLSGYVVNYYQQEVNGEDYKFISSEQYDDVYVGTAVEAKALTYKGFHLNEQKTSLTAVVEADGSTAIDVYYDRNVYYLYLNNTGDKYYEPISVLYGQTISDLPVPTKAGYVFNKWVWSNSLNGAEIQKPETMPLNDLYLNATWTERVANYTISYYIENANDSSYRNIGTMFEETTTATNVKDIRNLTKVIEDNFKEVKSDYQYFTYDAELTAKRNNNFDMEVKGDSSTLIQVYYKRNTYVLEFDLSDNSYGTKAVLTMNDTNYTTATQKYSFTAKYEQDIAELWPSYDNFKTHPKTGNRTYQFSGWSETGASSSSLLTSKKLKLSADMIVNTTLNAKQTFTANYSQSGYTSNLYYCFESFDQTSTTTSDTRRFYNGKYYDSQPELYQTAFSSSTNWNAKEITGVENVGKDSSGSKFWFYYDRHEFNITFYNVVQDFLIKTVKYKESAKSLEGIVPDSYPVDTPGDGEWIFEGWYRDPYFQTELELKNEDGSYKEIEESLTVYAKWSEPSYEVDFNLQGGTWTEESENYKDIGDNTYQLTVKEGTHISEPETPEKYGYNFLGWYYTTEINGVATEVRYLFEETQAVYHDIVLTAKWSTDLLLPYKVKYIKAELDEDGNMITDIKQYKNGFEELETEKVVNDVLFGTTITENALSIVDEETGQFWVVDSATKNLTINSMNEEDNTIYFFYHLVPELKYTIYYVQWTGKEYNRGDIPDKSEMVAPPETVTLVSKDGTSVSVNAINIPGYSPRLTWTKELQLIADESKNTLYFYYEMNHQIATYNINYYFMDKDGNYPLTPNHTSTGELAIGTTVIISEFNDPNPPDEKWFKGHELDETLSDIFVIITEGTSTVNVYYKNMIYDVKYHLQGGIWGEKGEPWQQETEETYFEKVPFTNLAHQPNVTPKNGDFRFLGWYEVKTDENGKTVSETPFDFETPIENNVELYAMWAESKEITVTKVWEDDNNRDGKRTEEVTISLSKNEEPYKDIVLNKEKVGKDTNTWKEEMTVDKYDYTKYDIVMGYENEEKQEIITSEELPVDTKILGLYVRPESAHINNGQTKEELIKAIVKYEVEEKNVPDLYEAEYNQETLTVTNKHQPSKINKTVTKIWRDNHGEDGLRTDYVDVQLKKNGENYGDRVRLSDSNLRAGSQDEWEYEFTDLYQYEDGEEIEWTVEEFNAPKEYSTKYVQKDLKIYNAYPPEVDIYVEKVWEDDNDRDGLRSQEVTVQLEADGKPFDEPVTLNEANNWTHQWEYLEKYNDEGDEYHYTIEEISSIPNYTSTTETRETLYERRFVITNTHTPATTSKTVTKEWSDSDDQDRIRPDSVKVQLKANGENEGKVVELNDDNGWTYTWDDLKLNANHGVPVTYTVEEVDVPDGYTPQYDQENLKITNVHEPYTVEKTVVKAWQDHNDNAGVRPDSVQVQLKADGTNYGEPKTLNAANNWRETWEDLPQYNEGEEITYTAEELTTAEHYTTEYSKDTYGITNSLVKHNYKVKYYYDDIEAPEKEHNGQADYGVSIEDYPPMDKDGYKVGDVIGTPLKVDETEADNIIEVHYVKRNDLTYTIRYIDEETQQQIQTEKVVRNQLYDSIVSTSGMEEEIDGYDFVKIDKEQIKIGTGENIVNVYYRRQRGLSYTVNYFDYDTRIKIQDPKVITDKTFGDIVKAEDQVETIYGYKYHSADPEQITIKTTVSENVINLYYVKKDTKVIVHYYEEGTRNRVAPDVTLPGKVFDTYITQEANDVPDKYELASIDGEKTGTMKEETIEVIYYYRKKATKVVVHHYLTDGRTQVAGDVTINGKIDDPYEALPAEEILWKYEVKRTSGNTKGIMDKDTIEVYYYYEVKDSKVIIEYREKGTEEQLRPKKEIIGKIDSTYDEKPIEIENYEFVGNSGEMSGTIGAEVKTVIFYYAQKTKVVVNHIDKTTGTIMETVEQEGLVGDEYTATEKYFKNYVLVGRPEKETVTMAKQVITLNYYYSNIAGGVLEKHVDKITNDVIHEELHEGKIGDEYEILSKTFDGYDLLETELPTNAKGTMTENGIEVVYYYTYRAKVIVEHIDKNTNKKIQEKEIEGHEGDEYKAEKLKNEDYKLVETEGVTEGKMTKKDIIVKFYYVHKSGGVIENHYDIGTGEKLAKEVKYEGYEGDEYNTSPKVFSDYVLLEEKYPKNAEGKMKLGKTEVNYYYAKKTKIIVKYVDKITGKKLADPTIIEGYEGKRYEIEPKEIERYQLIEEPKNQKGKMERNTKEFTYYYIRTVTITVKYIDKDTNKTIIKEVKIGKQNEKYKTEEKDIPYYKLIEKPKNAEGIVSTQDIEVNYYYRKKEFNLKIDKKIVSVIVNGETREINSDIGKTELYRKNVGKSKVEVVYSIIVTNDSEISGKATVQEKIPSGMRMSKEKNPDWKIAGNVATIITKEIKPNQTVEYKIYMDWITKEANLGTKTNIVEIVATENLAGYAEKSVADNSDTTEMIIAVGTGNEMIDELIVGIGIVAVLLVVLIGIAKWQWGKNEEK